MNRLNEQTTKC